MKLLASGALVALFLGLFVGSTLRPAIAYAAAAGRPELVAGTAGVICVSFTSHQGVTLRPTGLPGRSPRGLSVESFA